MKENVAVIENPGLEFLQELKQNELVTCQIQLRRDKVIAANTGRELVGDR